MAQHFRFLKIEEDDVPLLVKKLKQETTNETKKKQDLVKRTSDLQARTTSKDVFPQNLTKSSMKEVK